MIYYLIARRQANTMRHFLATWGKSLARRVRVLLYEDLMDAAPGRYPTGVYIFTSMGRYMGEYGPPSAVRRLFGDLRRRLVGICGPGRVLNDPEKFMLRVELLRALQSRGLSRIAVHRVLDGAAPVRYPVFLRPEHGSVWETPRLLRDYEEYQEAARSAAAGIIAVEYCDTADTNGIYRKYSCFIVGDQIVPRHLFFSRNWLVKQADLREPGMVEEEFSFVASNPHAGFLREVARMANISWGRIDYALLDGTPQVWEVNVTPAFISTPASDNPARRRVHQEFVRRLAVAMDVLEGQR